MATKNNLAFVFPGQGSQQVGMLKDLADNWAEVKNTFAEASEVLEYDLWQLIQEGPQDKLNLTENSQPALLAASVAVWRAWRETSDTMPAFMAGHSLGEWSALVCAGVVKYESAVKLVQLRGRFMQEAVPVGVGSMAAIIGLDNDAIAECCAKAAGDEQVTPVNYNSPGQVVIAGHTGAVERAIDQCKAAGAKRALPLPVSAPFHTALMKPAAEKLADYIRDEAFCAPKVPIVHNVNAATEQDPQKIKALMIEQIYAPVRWVECVEAITAKGGDTFVECGPGKVLSGLVKRIHKGSQAYTIDSTEALKVAAEAF